MLGSEFDSANNIVLSEVIISLLKQSQNFLCSDNSQKTIQQFPPTTGLLPSINFISHTTVPLSSIDAFNPGIRKLLINSLKGLSSSLGGFTGFLAIAGALLFNKEDFSGLSKVFKSFLPSEAGSFLSKESD